MSPVDTAELMRRPGDFDGVPWLLIEPVLLGADLLAELMVGRMADGTVGVRDIELNDGDLLMPTPPRAEWMGVTTPAALDLGRWCSPSESLA